MDIDESHKYTSLMVHQDKYLDGCSCVLYELHLGYEEIRDHINQIVEVDLSKYRVSGTFSYELKDLKDTFRESAFGIMFNPFTTRFIALDYDVDIGNEFTTLIKLCSKCPEIDGLDLITSSKGRSHIHIGFNRRINALSIFRRRRKICSGYTTRLGQTGAQTIRVSEKFIGSHKGPTILPVSSVRFDKNRKPFFYPGKRILPPVNCWHSISNTHRRKTHKINLRK